MTNQEFSDEFDILYNNASNQAPGLNEYEKSVFLTKAQEEILKAYFDPRGNKFQEGFDGSQKRQIDFSKSIEVKNCNKVEIPIENSELPSNTKQIIKFNTGKGTAIIKLDEQKDILMIINEVANVTRKISEKSATDIQLVGIPISFMEYNVLLSKPFRRPVKRQAWRIINSGDTTYAEIIMGANDTLNSYVIRYVKKPRPIVLIDLSEDGVSINGVTEESECELDSILHQEILQRAVELAIAALSGNVSDQIALGQTSQTNMGIVASSNSK